MRPIGAVVLLCMSGCGGPVLPVQPTDTLPQPSREFSLSGVVQDVMSRPVGDGRVEVLDGPRAGTFVITSASGGFEMPGVFSGPITVQASKAGLITATKRVEQPEDRRPRLFVSFGLEFTDPSAALYTLSGTVAEPGGVPIPGVRVSTSTGSSGFTDPQGRYLITGLFVVDKLTFEKDSYEPQGPFGAWYRNLDLNVKLQRSIYMQGGEQLAVALLPDDVTHEAVPSNDPDFNDMCGPCKLIRVAKPEERTLDVEVSSDNRGLTFGIWQVGKWDAHQIGNGELTASISTRTSEVQILVGTIWRSNGPPFAGAQSLRIRTYVR